jgi:transcriptional regulator with XRE-family HTH domain
MDGLIERLNVVFANSQKSIQDFAVDIHMDRGQFGKVLNGKMGITLKQLVEISSRYGVRTGWLIDGELPMGKKEKPGSFEPDLQLLTQIRKQVDELKVNFDTLFEPPKEPSKETSNLHYPNVDLTRQGKHRKVGKR